MVSTLGNKERKVKSVSACSAKTGRGAGTKKITGVGVQVGPKNLLESSLTLLYDHGSAGTFVCEMYTLVKFLFSCLQSEISLA